MFDLADPRIAPARPGAGFYLAHAEAGLMTTPVLDAVIGQLEREARIGGGPATQEAAPAIAAARATAARLIGAEGADTIALLESANRGLQAVIGSLDLGPGCRVLVDRTAWGGTLAMLSSRPGLLVEVIACDAMGRIDLDGLAMQLRSPAALLVLAWCPATSGLIHPAAAICRLARDAGAVTLIDAAQALGQVQVNVAELGCDALVASGRKWLRGPRGTALLYASRSFLARTRPPLPSQYGAALDLAGRWSARSDAQRFETGEASIAGRLGLAAALAGVEELGAAEVAHAIHRRAAALRERLGASPRVQLLDRGDNLSGIVAFTLAGVAGEEAAGRLARAGLILSALPAARTPLDCAVRGLPTVLRAAPHLCTSEDDLDRAAKLICGENGAA